MRLLVLQTCDLGVVRLLIYHFSYRCRVEPQEEDMWLCEEEEDFQALESEVEDQMEVNYIAWTPFAFYTSFSLLGLGSLEYSCPDLFAFKLIFPPI